MATYTLLLTPWLAPYRVVRWETSICMLYLGKLEVIVEYQEEVSSPSVSFNIPAVAKLKRVGPSNRTKISYSRANVLMRDNFQCQYCGVRKSPKHLNLDHVVPKCLGGKTNWKNIVASCLNCNYYKGGRTPEQAGMRLFREPIQPKSLPMTSLYLHTDKIPEEWSGYYPQNNTQSI